MQETTHFGYQTIPSTEKTHRVKEVFHSVAKKYDLMNDLMSLGLHRIWKRFAFARSQIQAHHQILDLAGGTGDMAALYAPHLESNGKVILTDINAAMLREARKRLVDKGLLNVKIMQADAEQLPFQENSFDCVSIAFGLRNITDKSKALSEMHRVLKPGGRLVILEFSQLIADYKNTAFSKAYEAYSFKVLPMLGKWVCNDAESYRYLAESIRVHPNQEQLKSMMEEVNFESVSYENINGGIVALHLGFKF